MILHDDCLSAMASMEAESVAAVVCDPPYGLEFMGKAWDKLGDMPDRDRGEAYKGKYPGWHGRGATRDSNVAQQTWHARWAVEALRVAKPSAYLLAFGGTRTVHRMTCAIEDAGWIIRDMLVWAYASGFPKSRASLKPAWEPIVMARKPGPLAMLNIDATRIGTTKDIPASVSRPETHGYGNWAGGSPESSGFDPNLGRWPANVVLTDPIFDGGWEGVVGGGETGPAGIAVQRNGGGRTIFGGIGDGTRPGEELPDVGYGDTGTYSRFFLVPKADRSDREPTLRKEATLEALQQVSVTSRTNIHPTVKPLDLMRHLVRLVTPAGGTVLDPFLGSGTTGIAAEMEGYPWIGIEREAEYVAIAEARLNGIQRGMGLVG